MTENERVKEIRKSPSVNLTLEKFGEKIGVQKSAVSKIERGENGLTDQMRLAICREFHVNEAWLRTGEGEMFLTFTPEETLHQLIIEKLPEATPNLRSAMFSLATVIDRLSDNDLKVLSRILDEWIEEIKK